MAQAKNPLFDTATVLGKIVAFLGVSALCGVLVAGLLVPAAAVTGSAASGSVQFFDDLPGELTVNPPGQATKVVAADGSTIATIYSENRTRVSLNDMSPFIKDGIVAIEDNRFYEHGGVDPTGIARALVATAKGSRQGASTITQQYVNNVINESLVAENRSNEVVNNGADKTVGMKLREMKLSIALEKKMSKDQILEGYLNIVFFNSQAYGIEAASRYFFSTSAKDLTLPQAATLAGVVNSPAGYNPITQPENSTMRRNLVLDAMLKMGKITQKQHDDAVKTPMVTKVTKPRQGCQYSETAPYFCDYVEHLILNDPAYGATEPDREALLARGGLTIKTTLDPRLQAPAQKQVDRTAGSNEDRWGAALITVQPGTGKILSMAQNSRKVSGQGSPIVTDYNYNVDRIDTNGNALGGMDGFQPGSTMKPVTLSAWLNEGKRTDDVVDATRTVYPAGYPWKTTCQPVDGVYDPSYPGSIALQNSEGNLYERMTVRRGITLSVNTATFATAAALDDFCDIQRMADALQLHTTQDTTQKTPQKLDMHILGNLLGSTQVAPMTMASAFATFANNGTYCSPIAIDSVVDAQGKTYPGQTSTCKETLKPDVAKAVTSVLQDVITQGSGKLIPDKVPAPLAGKTGTNNTNGQTWVVAYTKGLVTASYFGAVFDKATEFSGQGKWVNGQYYPRIDGAYIAGPQMAQYMQQVVGFYDTGAFDPAPSNLLGSSYTPPPVQNPKKDDKNSGSQPSTGPTDGNTGGGGNQGKGKKP
ncbi:MULTISPECIES: transglycosylase domain-containing protein [Arthrobacter]|uniref:Transglycosylase domain-containing protein n=2 Tax=Arthrobacter TaxID=1663 RepID=A0ABU9KNZ1_9MICC|nr:transglycosylase domain-containing protein [Arthrobacter sp. YJM1]MDP5227594.1 transglycosylase domain-containing protein [Arthrobacter sp. YJM1]